MSIYRTTSYLRLRSTPEKDASGRNIIDTMPPDTVVEKLEDGAVPGWVKVRTVLGNMQLEGFAAEEYLQSIQEPVSLPKPEVFEKTPTPVHLKTSRLISRNSVEGRAYPLNESNLVKRELGKLAGEADRKTAIHDVIMYLDVEHSVRYSPTTKSTYCNIYAYDLAYCLGVYLPRVWWQGAALQRAMNGEKPDVVYGNTVLELNANSLTNWFENYGPAFGWKRFFDLTLLQQEANQGKLGIIVAQRMNLNFSGHIVGVVPERPDAKATWQSNHVLSPLQSQAGVRNKRYFSGSNWWLAPNKYQKFGFWIWEG